MKKSFFRAILKKYGRLFIAMLLIASLGCGIASGMASGALSLRNSLESYVRDMEYPDAVITTVVTTRDAIEKIAAVPGVQAVDARLVGYMVVLGKDGRYLSVQAMTYDEEEFQKFYSWEESGEKRDDAVLLEYQFAKDNDFQVGDTITLRMGEEEMELVVGAIVSRPEMLGARQVGAIDVSVADLGFLYAPRALLATIENPDVTAAEEELGEKSKEFAQKENEANKEREDALAQLHDAQEELEKNRAELDQKLQEAEDALKELSKNKEDLEEKKAQLDALEKELKAQQKLLDEKKAELEKAKAELEAKKKELKSKRDELDALQASLEAQLSTLKGNLKEVQDAEGELAERKEAIRLAQEEILKTVKELTGQDLTLDQAIDVLTARVAELLQNKELLNQIQSYLQTASFMLMMAQFLEPTDFANLAVSYLGTMIEQSEAIASGLEQVRDKITELEQQATFVEELGVIVAQLALMRSDVRETLSSFGVGDMEIFQLIAWINEQKTVLQGLQSQLAESLKEQAQPEQISELIVTELQGILTKYQVQINETTGPAVDEVIAKLIEAVNWLSAEVTKAQSDIDYLTKAADEIKKQKDQLDEWLLEITSGETKLENLRVQIEDGIRQIEDGLKQIAAGYTELDGYDQQARDAEKLLAEKEAEIADYQKQIDDGWKKLRDGRRQLADAEKQIDEGSAQITKSVEEGKRQFADAEKEIEEGSAKLDQEWSDALSEFAKVRDELQKAREELDEWKGYDEFCNQFLLKFEPGADPEQTLLLAEAALEDLEVKNSYTFARSDVKRIMDVNINPLETMSFHLPMFFFMVALIVGFLFMSMVIRQSSREIGILRALGFSKGSILSVFCIANALMMVGASILGLFLGFAVAGYTGSVFQSYFHLHQYCNDMAWDRYAIAVLLTFLVGQLATVLNMGAIAKVSPAESMQRPGTGKAALSDGQVHLLGWLSPFARFSIASLLRNKLRFLFSVICISSTVALIFMAFSFHASTNRIQEELFGERIRYSSEIFLSSAPDDAWMENLNATGFVSAPEKVIYYSREIAANGVTKTVPIKAVEISTALNGIFDEKHERIQIPEDGIILDRRLAKDLGVKVGDMVSVGGESYQVTALSEQSEQRFQFTSAQAAERLGEGDLFSVICNVQEKDEVSLMEFLSKDESYIYVAYTRRNQAGVYRMLYPFSVCAMILILFSVMIGLVIIVSAFRSNLQEQKKEICILRALGHQRSELSGKLIIQAVPYFVLSCMIGLPAGAWATRFVLMKMETRSRTYPFMATWQIFAEAIGVVLVYVILSHALSMLSIRKWGIAENVKDKE